jgi:hypothetical protein
MLGRAEFFLRSACFVTSSIGQILLARALVCNVLGEYDGTPLSTHTLEVPSTPHEAASAKGAAPPRPVEFPHQPSQRPPPPSSASCPGFPRTMPPSPPERVSPRAALSAQGPSVTPPLETKLPPPPSPNSARKLSKEDFQGPWCWGKASGGERYG